MESLTSDVPAPQDSDETSYDADGGESGLNHRWGPCRRETKRRFRGSEDDLDYPENETETYRRASKISKFSLSPVKPRSCLHLSSQNGDDHKDSNLPLSSSVTVESPPNPFHNPANSGTVARSRKKRHFLDLNKRKSLAIFEGQALLLPELTFRPQSMAVPPLTVPATSSLTEFRFQPDVIASCFSSDSGISCSSSTQKSSTSSIPSSFASLSVAPQSAASPPSSPSSSLNSLDVPPVPFSSPTSASESFASIPVPPCPSPAETSLDDSWQILRSGAGRHSARDEELRTDARRTQLVMGWTFGRRGWDEAMDEVGSNFQSMTIDRKCLRDKALTTGKKKFNLSPAKGIEYLVQAGLLKSSSESVAEFLFKGEGLKKSSIGDFLGERKDFNIEVLRGFVNLHNFRDTSLVQALKQFLWSFRLPGESQKIDRIMEQFASKYCSDNPQKFSSSDTCFILSFALVMLNTSLHNSSVKDKLTSERFEDMVRTICQDVKVTSDELKVMYKSIKKEPLRFPEESGPDDFISTFFNPSKEGWLYKKSEKYNKWKKRWFVMSNGCLYYFTYKTDQQPRAIVPLENLTSFKSCDKKKEHCLEIVSTSNGITFNDNNNNNTNINNSYNNFTGIIKSCKTQAFGKVVEGTRTSFKLAAFTAEDCQEWIDCINKNTTDNPLQKLMVERRSKNPLAVRSRKKVTSIISPTPMEGTQQSVRAHPLASLETTHEASLACSETSQQGLSS